MSGNKWWKEHPWRMIQTNLREIDMEDIDAKTYVSQMKQFDATIAMINTAGIIASYKTELEDHFQSAFLHGDTLQQIIEECHKNDIRVVARNDLSKIRRPIYERHPEWAYRTAAGEIVDYNGDVHACLNGGYQQEYSRHIIREVLTKLAFDGMFFNMGGFQVRDYSYNQYGMCHCDGCRRRFREATGLDLPAAADLSDPAFRRYQVLKDRWVKEFEDATYQLIKSIRPEVAVNHYEFMRQEANTEFGRALPRWQYDAASSTRWVKTSRPGVVSSNTSVDFIGFYYRHVAVDPAQQEMRLWQSLANGGALDYYLIGRLDNHGDRSGYDRIKKVFAYHKRNEATYAAELTSEADVLLVRDRGESAEARGWIRFLTEHHFLFDEVVPQHFENASLDKYRCVVLPDLRYLSDKTAAALDAFAKAGGVVVATGESGFYTDELERRELPGLACLGIKKVAARRDDMRSAMFLIADKKNLPSCADTDFLYFGDSYVFADYAEAAALSLRLIPPHMYGPPERCYYTQVTDVPGMVVHPHGKGKGIYLPWLPGQLFYREGYVNTSTFLDDVLTRTAGVPKVQSTTGPMAEITVLADQQKRFRLVSVINNSGQSGVTFYDPVPMRDVEVTIPAPKAPRTATSLVDGRAVESRHAAGTLTLKLDVAGMWECVRLEE